MWPPIPLYRVFPLAPVQANEYPYDETRIVAGKYVRVVSLYPGIPATEWQLAIRKAYAQ